ncbi:MAG TPA: hypothetical protein VL485_07395 [Ktedonobacteraceae bacterium]|nr:hypothetical protein [Ktedonobacteraceae bacterium]
MGKSTHPGRLQRVDEDEMVSAVPVSKMALESQVEGVKNASRLCRVVSLPTRVLICPSLTVSYLYDKKSAIAVVEAYTTLTKVGVVRR